MGNCNMEYFILFINKNLGLILNIAGTIFLAFSFSRIPGKNPDDGGYTTDDKGKKYHFIYLVHPYYIPIGITLLLIGFLLQLII